MMITKIVQPKLSDLTQVLLTKNPGITQREICIQLNIPKRTYIDRLSREGTSFGVLKQAYGIPAQKVQNKAERARKRSQSKAKKTQQKPRKKSVKKENAPAPDQAAPITPSLPQESTSDDDIEVDDSFKKLIAYSRYAAQEGIDMNTSTILQHLDKTDQLKANEETLFTFNELADQLEHQWEMMQNVHKTANTDNPECSNVPHQDL